MAKKLQKLSPAHEKFCQHYCEYGNATQAYLFAFPSAAYGSAKTEGSRTLTIPLIFEKIEQLKEEFKVQFAQTREQVMRDLIVASDEAKALGQFIAYSKMKEQIIKLCKLYEPDTIIHSGNIDININIKKPNDGQSKTD